MKYLAHLEKSLNSDIISIYEVHKGMHSNDPLIWENREYYSLWYNTPMVAKVNSIKIAPHFAFKKGFGGNENSGGGESIEHQLSKKVIYDNKSLHLKIGDIEDKLFFSEVIIEKAFENGLYVADLYVKIINVNKFDFPIDSNLIIELHRTNKVKKSKQHFYRINNIAAIEIDIWDKINYEEDIEKLQKQLVGYFNKLRFAKTLHNPNYIKHALERKRKEHELNHKVEVPLKEYTIQDSFIKPETITSAKEFTVKHFNVFPTEIELTSVTKEESLLRKIIDFISQSN